jgi:predicted DNA-binding protein with PD1-like motif
MEYRKMGDKWVLVLRRGERIIEKLNEFVEKENVRSGWLNAIGAVSEVELAHYDLGQKRYSSRKYTQALEVVSLTGNVAVMGDERIIHCHIVVGTDEMTLYGGHLKEATVSATCEVVLHEFEEDVLKKEDKGTGLSLMSLG